MSHQIDIQRLTPDERLDLISELWDSLDPSTDRVRLTAAQQADLDKRLDELDTEGDQPTGVSWDEALRQIRQRHE